MSVLSTKTAEQLLRVMLNNSLNKFKEIELINKAKTGKGAAAVCIKNLVKAGILNEQRVGRAKLISLRMRNPSVFFLKNLFDEEKLRKLTKSKLAALLLFKEKVVNFVDLLVVFGSCVAGTATEESDVDIFVVSEQLNKVDAERKKVEELFGERFNIHSYSKNEIEDKIRTDFFIQAVLFKGIILSGFDFGQKLFSMFNVNLDLERLSFFVERIKSALRNYACKDYDAAREIVEQVLEQLTYYLLSEKKMNYASKKDAKDAIKSLPEGILIQNINKSPLKKKIVLSEELVLKLLKNRILERQGYDS